MKRKAVFLALLTGVLLIAGAAVYAAPPVQDATQSADDAAYLKLDLKAGFPLDPFVVSVNGGGPVEASTLDPACTGYVNTNPTLSVNWDGKAEVIRIFYYSDHDPTLVVKLPDGSFACNDDANRLLLDPLVKLENPASGQYLVWVGAADKGQLLPGLLVISARKDLDMGAFSLAGLVKRQPIVETLKEELTEPEREALAARLTGGIAMLKAAHDTGRLETFSQEIEVAGEIEAHELPLGETLCNGYISETPDLVFTVPENEKDLFVFFEGDGDGTLVIATPDGEFLCNDDVAYNHNHNPLVFIEDPASGEYKVFVGRVETDVPIKGKLIVTEIAKRPAVLAPEPAPTPAQ
jgi:hypothetical protein